MGVTGLWKVVEPTARPTKLETLNRKRLAVDASIWIYQFLKAVRDKEGNALRNSHVVGFFRRICKLLYFGIKPVFVFDGGAPVLKRETIRKRARRREGRRDDAARTAGKLLAVQVARAAEEEAARQRMEREATPEEEIPDDQELVYADEIGMSKKERMAGRAFKKKDQYHLPDLEVSLAEMGAPNDPRVMSQAELEEYAMQFHNGEDINLYDFSKIDFDSPFFQSLPPGDKYNILNAARLRSRLRMGYSKEQLDGMFPDRMAFSRFQIERVKERNELTQRLMHISGMNPGDWDVGGRIAGEKGKEYVLVRNDGVEGGWALGVVSNKQGRKKEDAIDVDEEGNIIEEALSDDEDEDFEDVAIEGINRIPQSWKRKRQETREIDYDMSYEEAAERIAKKRRAVYEARKKNAEQSADQITREANRVVPQSVISATKEKVDETSMFVDQDVVSDNDDEFEDVDVRIPQDDEDDELQRAIAMSLQPPEDTELAADDAVQAGFIVSDDDDALDLQAALAESRNTKYKSKTIVREKSPPKHLATKFQGPLPFESLNLGQSLLGKKKAKKVEEAISGGFDRDAGEDAFRKKQRIQPMPNWFAAASTNDDMRGIGFGDKYDSDDHITFGEEDRIRRDTLRKQDTNEVINVENDTSESLVQQSGSRIVVDGEDWNLIDEEELKRQEEADRAALEAAEVAESRRKAEEEEREKRYQLAREIAAETEEPTAKDMAENLPANPPPFTGQPDNIPLQRNQPEIRAPSDLTEMIEWSDSEPEDHAEAQITVVAHEIDKRQDSAKPQNNEDEDLFEDVEIPPSSPMPVYRQPPPPAQSAPEIDESLLLEVEDEVDGNNDHPSNMQQQAEEDFLADDSDEELMRQLAIEAEEHERFASSLNHNAPKNAEAARRDYENELKQLRNQQKKDRRDADEVTQTMIMECQALLRLFGLPYITAPMEAEAQCAELVHLGLVDGIVTDDSDIFLFGGTRIYKNMFNAAKFVECYLSSDLEKEYALDRKKLIRFAHLLGSDYTEGIPGIGPVTALEIISDFEDLSVFREWTLKLQLGATLPSAMENQLNTPFRRKFKKTVQKKLFLPTVFPDLRVDQAYLEPEVDSNPEHFQWGVPDLDKLRSFLMATIGWSQERTDEVLVPVVRDMNKREAEGVQSNLTMFFSGGVGVGGRGINGANGRAGTNGGAGAAAGAVEGSAPRNRTGKESGRMKNAYIRLRGEAEKQKRAVLENIRVPVSEEETVPDGDTNDETDRITTDDNDDDEEADNEGDDTSSGTGRKMVQRTSKANSTVKSAATKQKQRRGGKSKA